MQYVNIMFYQIRNVHPLYKDACRMTISLNIVLLVNGSNVTVEVH